MTATLISSRTIIVGSSKLRMEKDKVKPLPAKPTSSEWLGCEPNHFDVAVEEQGVRDVLAGLTPEERKQVETEDKTMPIRFFRVEKGNAPKATKRLKKTLQWRKDIGLSNIIKCMHPEPTDELTDEQLQLRERMLVEVNTGYFYVRGYTKEGRAILCSNPTVSRTEDHEMQYLHTIYALERAIACTARKSAELNNGRVLEKYVFIGDYNGYSSKHTPLASLLKRIFSAFTEHYPERLHCCYLINPNFMMRAAWSVVRPFLHEDVKKIVSLCCSDKDLEPFINQIKDLHKVENNFTQITKTKSASDELRPFNHIEYINLPMNVAFDE